MATLVPVFAHVRHVGVRRAITEPSPPTIIVGFYLFVFPLRALVIATHGYRDIIVARGVVSRHDVVAVLLLAAAATTIFVEAYHITARDQPVDATSSSSRWADAAPSKQVVRLAILLSAVSLLGLVGVVVSYGGLSATRAALLSHRTTSGLAIHTGIAGSAWQLFSVPAVWTCAYVALCRGAKPLTRVAVASAAAVMLLAALTLYGSRLTAILALLGVWTMYYYSGRRVPLRLVAVLVPLAVLVSDPILSARTPGPGARVSTIERYSRISSYGIFDASIAVYRQPSEVRDRLLNAGRWLDLPAYFVPAVLWHGRPNITTRRLGLYVAVAEGSPADRATGFPTTFIVEAWLIGGLPAVLVFAAAFGLLVGWAQARLLPLVRTAHAPAALLAYSFLVALAFTYYKDGDVLSTFIGQSRPAVYLAIILLVTGVWVPARRRASAASGGERDVGVPASLHM